MEPELTPGQRRLFDYLKNIIERTGNAPSLRQAAQDLGVSHAAISQGLKLLEQKGVVKRQGRYSRTLHLISPTGETAAAQRWRGRAGRFCARAVRLTRRRRRLRWLQG